MNNQRYVLFYKSYCLSATKDDETVDTKVREDVGDIESEAGTEFGLLLNHREHILQFNNIYYICRTNSIIFKICANVSEFIEN